MKHNKLLTYIFLGLNILLIIANFVNNYFYQLNGFDFTLKLVGSGLFVAIGIVNLIYAILMKRDIRLAIIFAISLTLAFLGDAAINWIFPLGAGLFALGHIGFVIAYFLDVKANLLDFIISGVIALSATLFILLAPFTDFGDPSEMIICLVYGIIISFMVGKAFANFIRKKQLGYGIIALASFLFFFSDLMLLIAWFTTLKGGFWDNLCMATYYPGLCFLALSLFVLNTIPSDFKD